MPKFQITAKELNRLIEAEKVVLIDVREMDEYQDAHISDSVLIPLDSLSASKIPSATNKSIVIHCQSGRHSNLACDQLLKENAQLNLHNLTGGIEAWEDAGLPVLRAGMVCTM